MDPNVKNENLGYLRLFLKITAVIGSDMRDGSGSAQPPQDDKKNKTSRVWTNILTVTLLEAHNLPAMDQNGENQPHLSTRQEERL